MGLNVSDLSKSSIEYFMASLEDFVPLSSSCLKFSKTVCMSFVEDITSGSSSSAGLSFRLVRLDVTAFDLSCIFCQTSSKSL